MREKIIEILEAYEVSSWDISDLTDELLNLFGVSNCEHDFVRTGDSFDLSVYCSKCGEKG